MKPIPTIIIAFVAGLAGAYTFFQFQERKEKAAEQQAMNVANYESTDTYRPTVVAPSNPSTIER
jgi:hypothetical protein